MTHYWELYALLYTSAFVAICIVIYIIVELVPLAYTRHKQWKAVKPHYGSVYDASVRGDRARPNVDLRRTR